MTKLKTLKQPEIDKLINQLEKSYDTITKEPTEQELKNMFHDSFRLGQAQATIQYLIKQLKGEWPI